MGAMCYLMGFDGACLLYVEPLKKCIEYFLGFLVSCDCLIVVTFGVMKRYRLLRWYPSLGRDCMHRKVVVSINNGYAILGYRDKDGLEMNQCIDRSEVENNPDYWELEKEKSYDVLNYRDGFTPIYRVKRASDGVIFTIGDRVKLDVSTFGKNEPFEITSFTESVEWVSGLKVGMSGSNPTRGVDLNAIEMVSDDVESISVESDGRGEITLDMDYLKDKTDVLTDEREVVLRTEDGVDIYDKDKYWWCGGGKVEENTARIEGKHLYNTVYAFSTEEAARKHVETKAYSDYLEDKIESFSSKWTTEKMEEFERGRESNFITKADVMAYLDANLK